jgi:hypothetical protein
MAAPSPMPVALSDSLVTLIEQRCNSAVAFATSVSWRRVLLESCRPRRCDPRPPQNDICVRKLRRTRCIGSEISASTSFAHTWPATFDTNSRRTVKVRSLIA